jgi:hypothetical protein
MKKTLSILLALAQIFLTVPANAADTTQTPSQEVGFLSQLIALQGQRLSSEDFQQNEKKIVADYMSSAPAEGMQDRLLTAATYMRVISTAQASAIQQESEKAAAQFTAQGGMTEQSLTQAVTGSVHGIFGRPMNGAPFAGCDAITVAEGLGITALAGFVFLVASRSHTTENAVLISIAATPIAVFGLITLTLGLVGFSSQMGC